MKTKLTTRPFGVLLLIGSIAAALAPAGALAQQRAAGAGWYSGLSVGGSEIGMSDGVLPVTGATATSLSKDESSTGFKLFAGYRYNPNFALEGGYTDFGKFDARRNVTAPVVGSMSRNTKVFGFHLDAVGILPLQGGFSLFGKLGALYSVSKSSISTDGAIVPLATTSLNPKRSEWNPKVGLGAGYDFSNGLGLRLEYERVGNVGDTGTGEGNIGMWSIGLTKRY